MSLEFFIPLLVTSLITVFSWYFAHRNSKNRDLKNKRRELRVNYLLEAWRKLEYAANRPSIDKIQYIEKPIADIQLLGSKKQVTLAQAFAKAIASDKSAKLNDLLEELRKDLRKELNLETLDNLIIHLRFFEDKLDSAG